MLGEDDVLVGLGVVVVVLGEDDVLVGLGGAVVVVVVVVGTGVVGTVVVGAVCVGTTSSFTPARGGKSLTGCPWSAPCMNAVQILVG